MGCHRGLLARNVLADLAGNGIQCKGGSEDVEIRWNHLTNAGAGVRVANVAGDASGRCYLDPPSIGAFER